MSYSQGSSGNFAPPPIGLAMLQDEMLTRGVLSRRVLAWIVDLFLVGIVVAAVWTLLMVFGLLTLGFGFPLMGLLPVIPVLYHWLFLAGPNAATPGQSLLGLIVLRNDDLGRPGSLQALVFTLLFYLTLALGAIWMVVALFTTRHRALHDIFSGLVVVRARALTGPPGY